MYFVTTPRWMRWMYPGLTWEKHTEPDEKILYLTFDDGPHPIATPFVLDALKLYNAKATFFCIGKNVVEHPDIYQRIIAEGHSVGNHTYHHLNGWKVKDKEYIDDINKAGAVIDSSLFRPPHGRISRFQSKALRERNAYEVIMWSVLSGDWDNNIDGKKCYENVVLHARSGSIVVFHDSAKALDRMQAALPKVLTHYQQKGYSFHAL